MGKKNKSAAKPAQDVATPSEEVSGQLQNLKDQGNKCFGLTQYQKALESYEKALKLLPEGSSDREDFHLKKSACLLKLSKYKEAVKECNQALEVQPSSVSALKRRASAYEQQGLFKQALADIAAVNKSDAATTETKEAEKRLKDIMSGRNKPVSANGAAVRAPQRPVSRPSPGTVFTAKCTLNNETRLIHMPANVTYADLLTQVKNKFPEAGNVVLKYLDREGDLVTVTSRLDIQKGLAEVIQSVGGLTSQAKLAGLPPLKIQVVEVATAEEVPSPPADETQELYQQHLAAFRKKMQEQQAEQQRQVEAAAAQQPQQQEGLELEDWLTDFIDLFANQTGLDPWRSEAMASMGMEETQKALLMTLKSPEAEGVLRKAASRFQEATAMQLLNWGNTHQYLAQRFLEDAAGEVTPQVLAKVEAEYKEAEKRFKEALGYKSDFADATAALANLEFERAKIDAGIFIAAITKEQQEELAALEKESPEKAQVVMSRYLQANLLKALEASSKSKLQGLKKRVGKVWDMFEVAVRDGDAYAARLKEEEAAKVSKEGDKEAEVKKDAADSGLPQQDAGDMLRIMYGNVLYEWSQFMAHIGEEWRPVLDKAVGLFTTAKCPQKDINTVLRNHLKGPELDVPADEPEAAAAPAAEEAKPVEKKEAKGLPSLEVRKKDKK